MYCVKINFRMSGEEQRETTRNEFISIQILKTNWKKSQACSFEMMVGVSKAVLSFDSDVRNAN